MPKCTQCHKSGMFLQLEQGLCASCLMKRLEETSEKLKACESRITPELKDAETTAATLSALKKQLTEAQQITAELEQKLTTQRKELLFVTDAVTMESYALYVPRYEFTKSEDYNNKLKQIRDSQKTMLRDHTAIIYNSNFTINGNKAAGKRLLTDLEKLFLRSFNNECEMATLDVRHSNYDRCRERILKAFEEINKLGSTNSMSISFQYRQLKLDELTLAFEFQVKKEEERQRIRELKAQEREEARVAKEIEEARKQAEKEKKHYIQALEQLKKQAQDTTDESLLLDIKNKQKEICERLDVVETNLSDIDYRQNNQRAGYVYIISNIGSFGEDVYKIGMTRRLEPMERIYELGDASVPFLFDVHALIFTEDAPKLETALHQAFQNRRLNKVNLRREYFHVSLDEIKEVISKNFDRTVEYIDVPEAQQYRDSLLITSAGE